MQIDVKVTKAQKITGYNFESFQNRLIWALFEAFFLFSLVTFLWNFAWGFHSQKK